MRWAPRGTLHNISGYRTAWVTLLSKKKSLIRTDEPEALKRAIEKVQSWCYRSGSSPRRQKQVIKQALGLNSHKQERISDARK